MKYRIYPHKLVIQTFCVLLVLLFLIATFAFFAIDNKCGIFFFLYSLPFCVFFALGEYLKQSTIINDNKISIRMNGKYIFILENITDVKWIESKIFPKETISYLVINYKHKQKVKKIQLNNKLYFTKDLKRFFEILNQNKYNVNKEVL